MRIKPLILVALIVGTALLASSVVAGASQKTSARVYRAFSSTGAPKLHVIRTVRGSCFSGSIEAARSDAWRCMNVNHLYDPCFSSGKATGIVLCPVAAWKRSGVEIELTRGLPKRFGNKRAASTKGGPWAIETTTGLRCVLQGMGPFVSRHEFADYACNGGQWLWEQPNRKAQPWTIAVGKAKPAGTAKVKLAWF